MTPSNSSGQCSFFFMTVSSFFVALALYTTLQESQLSPKEQLSFFWQLLQLGVLIEPVFSTFWFSFLMTVSMLSMELWLTLMASLLQS